MIHDDPTRHSRLAQHRHEELAQLARLKREAEPPEERLRADLDRPMLNAEDDD